MDKDTQSNAAETSLEKLKQESHALKERIEELRRKTEMPVNSSLGDPAIDAANADGHNDLPDDEED
jgi:cell division protein FtsB